MDATPRAPDQQQQQPQPKQVTLEQKFLEVKAFAEQAIERHDLHLPPEHRKPLSKDRARVQRLQAVGDLQIALAELQNAWTVIGQMKLEIEKAAVAFQQQKNGGGGDRRVLPATMAELNVLLRAR